MQPSALTEKSCKNCGEQLHGKYCHNCGQEDIDYNVSLKHLIPEVLHEYFGFDSQIFKSIPLLLVKPGYLTNEFNTGHRERYIPPVRMYFFVSLIFFFLVSLSPNGIPLNSRPAGVPGDTVQNADTLRQSDTLHSVDSLIQSALNTDTATIMKPGEVQFYFNNGTPQRGGRYFTINGNIIDSSNVKGKWYAPVVMKANYILDHQNEFFAAVAKNLPVMMFFLLPLSALLLKLLYIRKKLFYVEHLVFVIHMHCFIFILFGVVHGVNMMTTSAIVELFLVFATTVLISVYLFKALRSVYRQSIIMTSVKFIVPLNSYGIAVIIAFLALFTVTAALM